MHDGDVHVATLADVLRAMSTLDKIKEVLTPTQARIFEFVLRNPGCHMPDIIQAVWPNPDNEGDCSNQNVCAQATWIRRKIKPFGYTIIGKRGPRCVNHGWHVRALS